VTPARDEAGNLAALAASVRAQSIMPCAWVIVDDGSSDGTAEVVARMAREDPWIALVTSGRDRGRVARGRREGRALLSFQEGVRVLDRPVELVCKLDADVTLSPDYFARIVAAFARDPRLGLASGRRCELQRGRWRRRHLTGRAVEAQARTYRMACWNGLQPLEPRMGWDSVDEARAVLTGWRTHVVDDLEFRHHRTMGRRDGSRIRARAAEGDAAHYLGYRPSYLALRALWNALREPAAVAMIWGFAVAAVRCRPKDAVARVYFRRQQSARHLARRWREARGDWSTT
jgi:poly-beta-1,6-N-acetyl-D-glucosamine synthase